MEVPWQVVTGTASVSVVMVVAIWSLGWWLRGYLQEIKDAGRAQIDEMEEAIVKKYDDLEEKGQKRHEDNLIRLSAQDMRLAVIETRLTTIIRNDHSRPIP